MTERVTPRRRGSYGIDAPYAPAFIAVAFVVELVFTIISGRVLNFLAALVILAILILVGLFWMLADVNRRILSPCAAASRAS